MILSLSIAFGSIGAMAQMGPWIPFLGPIPSNVSGYAAGVQIVNGTAKVLCFEDPTHVCIKKIAASGKPGAETFDASGTSLLKFTYDGGRYRTDDTARKSEYEFNKAVKL